jgi:hypothetical protein
MFNMSYNHTGDKKLKLLDMMTRKWPFPSTPDITILEIVGRTGGLKDLIKISPEYGYQLKGSIEDLQKSESTANKPIVIPNFRQEFEGPNTNNNRRMTASKLRKIGRRTDPEILKKRFIRQETAKRKRGGVRSVQFRMAYKHGDKTYGMTFTVFRNGSTQASGKFFGGANFDDHEDAHAFLNEKYGFPINKMKFNNITSSFGINSKPNLNKLVRDAPKRAVSDKNIIKKTGKLKKPVEKETPRVARGIAVIPLKNGILRVGVTGRCQIVRVTDPNSLTKAYNEAKEFLRSSVTGPYGNLPATTVSKTRVEKYIQGGKAPEVLRRGTTCPTSRCPKPYGFQGKCPQTGYYIKPNPQGQPCCYKIPKSLDYSKNKVAKAYKKADVQISNSAKNLFNLKNKNGALSNTTHSSNKNFIKVLNDPTVNKAYIEDMDRLYDAWKSKRTGNGMWTIRTRPGAKAQFEDPMTLNVLIAKARGRKNWHIPDVSKLKLDTRQCTRYTKVALMDIAKRLNIIEAHPSMKKEVLCHLIRKATRGTSANKTNTGSAGGITAVTVKDGDKVRAITGKGLNIRIGARQGSTFDTGRLTSFAKQLGASGAAAGLTKDAILQLISQAANGKRTSLEGNINKRKRDANEAAAKREEQNARRAKDIANRVAANMEKEYVTRLRELGLVNKKGRGQMNAVMPPAMYLNLSMNKNRRNAMRENLVNMARAAMKTERLKPVDFELTASGAQKGVIKRFLKAFESDVEAKYRPIYYNLLANGNKNMSNKIKTFANTVPTGKKARPSFKQIKSFSDKLKKKANKK